MIEKFKKTILAGLGAAVVTKDKVLDGLDDLVKQGKISAADARTAADKIASEGRKEFDKAGAALGERAREFLSYADGEYVKRLRTLEVRIAALEKKPAKAAKRSAGS
jgi:polyhydroxyalkanoate synthesis regulator phasin